MNFQNFKNQKFVISFLSYQVSHNIREIFYQISFLIAYILLVYFVLTYSIPSMGENIMSPEFLEFLKCLDPTAEPDLSLCAKLEKTLFGCYVTDAESDESELSGFLSRVDLSRGLGSTYTILNFCFFALGKLAN